MMMATKHLHQQKPPPVFPSTTTNHRNINKYHNGVVRRRCICGKGELCVKIWKFWCEYIIIDDARHDGQQQEGGVRRRRRDPALGGEHIRVPLYHAETTTPAKAYENAKRRVYYTHLWPAEGQEEEETEDVTAAVAVKGGGGICYCSSKDAIERRPQGGQGPYEYIARHHFPSEYMAQDGSGLKEETVSEQEATSMGLRESDLFRCHEGHHHPHDGRYILPPMRPWNDVVSEFEKKGGIRHDDSPILVVKKPDQSKVPARSGIMSQSTTLDDDALIHDGISITINECDSGGEDVMIDCAAKVHFEDVGGGGGKYEPALFEQWDAIMAVGTEEETDSLQSTAASIPRPCTTAAVSDNISSNDEILLKLAEDRDLQDALENLLETQKTETEAAAASLPSVGVRQNADRDGSTAKAAIADELFDQQVSEKPGFAKVLADTDPASAIGSGNPSSTTCLVPNKGNTKKASVACSHSSVISLDPSKKGAMVPRKKHINDSVQAIISDASINEPSQKRQKKHGSEQLKPTPPEPPRRNHIYMGQFANKGVYATDGHKLFLREVKVWQCRNRRKQLQTDLKDRTNLLDAIHYLLGQVEAKIKEKPVLFHRPSADKCSRLFLDDNSNDKARASEHRRIVRAFLLGNKGALLKGPLQNAETQLKDYEEYLTNQAFVLLVQTSQLYVRSVRTDNAHVKEVEERGHLRTLNDLLARMLRESGLNGGSSVPLNSKHLLDYDEPSCLDRLFGWDSDSDDDNGSDYPYGLFVQSSSESIDSLPSYQTPSHQESVDSESDGTDRNQISSISSSGDTATHLLCNEDENSAEGLSLSFGRLSHNDPVSDLCQSDTTSADNTSCLDVSSDTLDPTSASKEETIECLGKTSASDHDTSTVFAECDQQQAQSEMQCASASKHLEPLPEYAYSMLDTPTSTPVKRPDRPDPPGNLPAGILQSQQRSVMKSPPTRDKNVQYAPEDNQAALQQDERQKMRSSDNSTCATTCASTRGSTTTTRDSFGSVYSSGRGIGSNNKFPERLAESTEAPTTPGSYWVTRTQPPGLDEFLVTVPEDCGPGSHFPVNAGNRMLRVECPAHARSGQELSISVPKEYVYHYKYLRPAQLTRSPAATAARNTYQNNQEVSLDGSHSMLKVIKEINDEAIQCGGMAKTFVVVVPDNVKPGQKFYVHVDGTGYKAICPPGSEPGSKIRIAPEVEQSPTEPPPPQQVFVVQVPEGVGPGGLFTFNVGNSHATHNVLVRCPPDVEAGQAIRVPLPTHRVVEKIQLAYPSQGNNGWVRTVRAEDLQFQWVRLKGDETVVSVDSFDFCKSAYVRKIMRLEGNDPKLRTGMMELVPAEQAAVRSKLKADDGHALFTYADIAYQQGRKMEEKHRWFLSICKKLKEDTCREDPEKSYLKILVRRDYLLPDSMQAILSLSVDDMRRPWSIGFAGEPGVGDGPSREWFQLVTEAIFDPRLGLFQPSANNQAASDIHPGSGLSCPKHLKYFRFMGRVLGRALFNNHLIKGHLVRMLYKHILGWPITPDDVKALDEAYFNSLVTLSKCPDVSSLDIDFTKCEESLGQHTMHELVEGGSSMAVTNENISKYLEATMRYHMFGQSLPQLTEMILGFYDVIPEPVLTVFDLSELELILCGLPKLDLEDWKENTNYRGLFYKEGTEGGTDSPVVRWFWDIVEEEFDPEMKARLLQFGTGTSGVPAGGFAYLQGHNRELKKFTIQGVQQDTCLYPKAHTCFNQIELPNYASKEVLRERLTVAITTCYIGFDSE